MITFDTVSSCLLISINTNESKPSCSQKLYIHKKTQDNI